MYYLTLLRNLISAHPYETLVVAWLICNALWAQLPAPKSPGLFKMWRAVHALLGLAVTHTTERGTFAVPALVRVFVEGLLEICGKSAIDLGPEQLEYEPRRRIGDATDFEAETTPKAKSFGGSPSVPSVRPPAEQAPEAFAVPREAEATPAEGLSVPAPQPSRSPDSAAFGADVFPVRGKE